LLSADFIGSLVRLSVSHNRTQSIYRLTPWSLHREKGKKEKKGFSSRSTPEETTYFISAAVRLGSLWFASHSLVASSASVAEILSDHYVSNSVVARFIQKK
jgi:hypothetical protein